MHRYLRSIGFQSYTKKRDIEGLLALLEKRAMRRRIELDDRTNLCEYRAETAPGMGVVMVGEMDAAGTFHREFYYPYMKSPDVSSDAACTLERQTEKETYAGLLDEYRVGTSLIFYLDNAFEYQERRQDKKSLAVKSVNLTALAEKGKILLPIYKTKKQIEMARVAARDRNSLIEAARNGDEQAMETLTIEDIDLYSQVSRRAMREDIYSIIDSSFMPSGIECDQYAVIGEITAIDRHVNQISEELVYDLTLSCSDLVFHVCIAARDLLGEPVVGRRFKGTVWMQGTVRFA